MRNTLLASLLIGAASLVAGTADAAPLAATGKAPIARSEAVAPAREAGEAPRGGDRQNDRQNDRRNDRRNGALEQADDGAILLIREGGSRNQGRRGP
jgi:hypothetical protein